MEKFVEQMDEWMNDPKTICPSNFFDVRAMKILTNTAKELLMNSFIWFS